MKSSDPEREYWKELIVKRMYEQHVRIDIINEFEEQYIFLTSNKLISMSNWNGDKFEDWYDN
jgi:hypothetical protein